LKPSRQADAPGAAGRAAELFSRCKRQEKTLIQ
jgi:hypothetical protein